MEAFLSFTLNIFSSLFLKILQAVSGACARLNVHDRRKKFMREYGVIATVLFSA